MRYLNGKEIIDSALTVLKNNSAPVRNKMLTWLNVMAVKLEVERAWTFLGSKSATLTPVNGVISLPSDYSTFESLSADGFFLTPSRRLTEAEAWQADHGSPGSSVPTGFTEGSQEVTTYGPTDTTITNELSQTFNQQSVKIYSPTASVSTPPPGYAVAVNGAVDTAITLPAGTIMDVLSDEMVEAYAVIPMPIQKRQMIVTVPKSYSVALSDNGSVTTIRITSSSVVPYPDTVLGDDGAYFYFVTLPYDYTTPITNYQPILTIHGASPTGSITLTYSSEPADFTDDIVITSWPRQCLPIFLRGLLDAFYEYDMDERAANSYQLNPVELSKLKAWDNLRKPKSQTSNRGYRRTL